MGHHTYSCTSLKSKADGLGIIGNAQHATHTTRRCTRPSVPLAKPLTLSYQCGNAGLKRNALGRETMMTERQTEAGVFQEYLVYTGNHSRNAFSSRVFFLRCGSVRCGFTEPHRTAPHRTAPHDFVFNEVTKTHCTAPRCRILTSKNPHRTAP